MAQMDTHSVTATSTTDALRLPSCGSVERVLIRQCQSMNPNLRLLRKGNTHKRFDSGDWCLERQGLRCADDIPLDVSMEQLSPKLSPDPAATPRARSALHFSKTDIYDSNGVVDDDGEGV
eukprot:g7542.t1